ncbi:MAG: HD domain-containing protein [Trueperaceae bacterium]
MAKPAPWYFNAARRTLLAAFPRLARPDDGWATTLLEGGEAQLFLRLPPTERLHGIEVARRLLARTPTAEPVLVRAALLHDVGKLGTPHFFLWRVLTHLLPEAQVSAEPRRAGLAGARQARVHHPGYGAALIRLAGGAEEVARLVERHHDELDAANPRSDLALLKAADERT